MTRAAGVRERQDEEDSERVKCVGGMSKAVIVLVKGMTNEKDSEGLENLVRLQIKEEMKDTKETLAHTLKGVEKLRELTMLVGKRDGMNRFN